MRTKSLMDEVSILQCLRHPNITQLYDFIEDDEAYYVVLDLARGGELLERVSRKVGGSRGRWLYWLLTYWLV